MPNFAPINTPRVVTGYVSAGVQHKVILRRPRGEGVSTSLTNARATFEGLAGTLQALLPDDFAWLSERYIPQDSDIEQGTGYTGPGDITGAIAVALYTPTKKITATTFTGRSVESNGRLSIFGVFWDMDTVGGEATDGIVLSGESPAIANSVALLNSTGETYAIDGTQLAFNPYATVKPNDKLLKLVRRGLIT